MISLRLKPANPRRVSLTPLIDVVFILLVFFMLETTFREEGGLTMLASQKGNAGSATSVAMVELFDTNWVWIDGQRFAYPAWLQKDEQIPPVAEVRTAPTIPLQHVVDVVDRLKFRGAERVRLSSVQGFN